MSKESENASKHSFFSQRYFCNLLIWQPRILSSLDPMNKLRQLSAKRGIQDVWERVGVSSFAYIQITRD